MILRTLKTAGLVVLGFVLTCVIGFSVLFLVQSYSDSGDLEDAPNVEPTSSSEPTGPAEPSASSTPRPLTGGLKRFVEQCGRGMNYREGQVDYPRRISVRLGQTTTYGAAVDIRDAPLPPRRVIPGEDPTAEPVVVQCVVGARLVAVGRGMEVQGGESSDGGWRYQRFIPSGVVEWSWSVTALSPRQQELRLDIRPAARTVGTLDIASTASTSFVTSVEVESSWIERLADWFQTEWPRLTAVAFVLAGAVTAVLIFSKETRMRVADLTRRRPPRRASAKK
jgi:hypothetical protein